ncbi:MAG: radical SAM protein [bacterium]|nr:radical SAM protein [bacterium]
MVETKKKAIDPVKLYYTREYHEELSGKVIDFPKLLLLQASSYCNYTCLMCRRHIHVPQRDDTGLGEGHMSPRLIEKLVEECRPEKSFLGFHFAEYGEPLMNPRMAEMISIISRSGLKSQVVTNGFYLDDKMCRQLIEAGLSKIKISFQGATEEKYKFWRNNDYYRKIVENVHRLVEIRDRMKSDLFIQVGTSSCDDTEEELQQFVSYWENKVDHVYWNYTALNHLQGEPFLEKVNIIRQAPLKSETCWELFLRMTVVWDGRVTQCACDEEHFIGDLNTSTIRDIWHGDKMNENRQLILTRGNVLEHCKYCSAQPKETLNYKPSYKD